jgi:DNA alkylation repair enzyme
MQESTSAERFVEELETHRSPEERETYRRYFKTGEGEYGEGDMFIGVRMGQVFALAKEFIDMPPEEIEKLLESPVHEARAGALSIMDKKGRANKTPESRRKELFDLYLRRTDRIDSWDLVDLGAPYVVGRYLFDKPRNVLYELACSRSIWERRTAIVGSDERHRPDLRLPHFVGVGLRHWSVHVQRARDAAHLRGGGVGGSHAYADTRTGTTFALTKNWLTPNFDTAEKVAGIVTKAVADS